MKQMKKHYGKPTMTVYELQHRTRLLDGSQKIPLDNEETTEQW